MAQTQQLSHRNKPIGQRARIPTAPKSSRAATYASLQRKWSATFGQAPAKNLSRRLLELAVAYELQARTSGTLSSDLMRDLRAAAASPRDQIPQSRLTPGVRLVREWNGNTYVVEVTESGFVMNKRQFRSLTAVALAITGTHWNGRVFFGLKKTSRKSRSKHATVDGSGALR